MAPATPGKRWAACVLAGALAGMAPRWHACPPLERAATASDCQLALPAPTAPLILACEPRPAFCSVLHTNPRNREHIDYFNATIKTVRVLVGLPRLLHTFAPRAACRARRCCCSCLAAPAGTGVLVITARTHAGCS